MNRKYFPFNMGYKNFLDLNNIKDDNIVVFPLNIYKGEPVKEPETSRDPIDHNYIYCIDDSNDVKKYSSKFERNCGNCLFGYCYGSQSGRNYNLPPVCHN